METLDDLREFVTTQVRMGVLDDQQILDEACAIHPEIEPSVVLAEVLACSRTHAEQEQTWTEPTDADRLETAFGELAARGYIPGWNLGRSWREATREVEALADGEYAKAKRYVVFCDPELENAVKWGSLELGYGDLDDSTEGAALAAAREVVDVLTAASLNATWDGTHASYIRVAVGWRVRRRELHIAALTLEA